MDVKGEALISLPLFIIKKFGKEEFERWLSSLSTNARKTYSAPINKGDWFPMVEMLVKPTMKMCDMFYNGNVKGAFECGRFSAEYGLKGIYKVLVKLSSPEILIQRAKKILNNYYKPSAIEVIPTDKAALSVRISKFPEMNACIEQRIAGWMQRAVEITGTGRVTVRITHSLTRGDHYSEFAISWVKNVV